MNIVAIDPYGNRVIIPENLIPAALKSTQLQQTIDRPDQVITQPALMLTTCTEAIESCTGPCVNHYYRLIGLEETLLISAQKEKEDWVAISCIINPSTEQMAAIMHNARQLK
ncbi:MAG TPA: hypothetical protein VD794_02490 [Flavisolibacter sp.]|nr:hypothetical protein [Flavisolibacter sp.]